MSEYYDSIIPPNYVPAKKTSVILQGQAHLLLEEALWEALRPNPNIDEIFTKWKLANIYNSAAFEAHLAEYNTPRQTRRSAE